MGVLWATSGAGERSVGLGFNVCIALLSAFLGFPRILLRRIIASNDLCSALVTETSECLDFTAADAP